MLMGVVHDEVDFLDTPMGVMHGEVDSWHADGRDAWRGGFMAR